MNSSVAYDRDQMVFTVDILTHYTTRQFYIQPEREGDGGGINTACSHSNQLSEAPTNYQ